MEARVVTISPKTYDLSRLNKAKKTALRRKLIVEHIQSKPAGTVISNSEFMRVGQFASEANTHAFLKRMVRDGVIGRYDGDRPRSHYYSVIGAVRVRQSSEPVPAAAKVEEAVPQPAKTVTNVTLTSYAQRFAWERNSDSLREFVAYMDGKELDLRRLADKVEN